MNDGRDDRNNATIDPDAPTLPNLATNMLMAILGTSSGAMDCYVTVMVRN